MLIGILSDTHGDVAAMKAAMALLKRGGAQFYIHCGDVGTVGILEQLTGHPAAFVFGNCDFERTSLGIYATSASLQCLSAGGDLTLDGKLIAVMHGDFADRKKRVLDDQRHDYLLLGHTHVRKDERIGRVRVINPGALHRAAEPTVALLDTATDHLEFLVIPRRAVPGLRP
jgi:hypothetical protein